MPYNNGMKNKTLTRNQIRLLDGLCDRWTFDQQVELAYEIWPDNYSYVRKCFSRLHNLQFIEWVSQDQTSYGERWWVTEKGVRFVIDNR